MIATWEEPFSLPCRICNREAFTVDEFGYMLCYDDFEQWEQVKNRPPYVNIFTRIRNHLRRSA